MKVQSISNKAKDTCTKRYGGTGLGSPVLKEKIYSTFKQKYGETNPSLIKKSAQKKIITRHNTTIQKYEDVIGHSENGIGYVNVLILPVPRQPLLNHSPQPWN